MKHVIIGNGPAGVVAAEALRRYDPQADITLIGEEAEAPYSRMAIPYFLNGSIPDQGTHLRKAGDHYERHGIHLHQGRVVRVEPESQTVVFEDDSELGYDRLLVASGCYPVRPPLPGIELPGVHTCWTLADARAIVAEVQPGARVVQMGAGFVGSIIIQALVSRGAQLTILVRSGRMVSRMMPPKASEMIAHWCEAQGVRIMGKTQAAKVERDGTALKVTLTTGETLPADVYLSLIGVKPGIGFLAGSGIAIETGIVVDEHLRTNVPGVYAVGDVAESRDRLYGKYQINAIQPNAVEQARIAAINMAGGDDEFVGSLAINVLDTLGLISCSFGQWQGEQGGESVEMMDAAKFQYLSLQFGGDHMVGATTVGFTDHVGALRGLIQGKVKLGAWRERLLADPSLFMSAYLATAEKLA